MSFEFQLDDFYYCLSVIYSESSSHSHNSRRGDVPLFKFSELFISFSSGTFSIKCSNCLLRALYFTKCFLIAFIEFQLSELSKSCQSWLWNRAFLITKVLQSITKYYNGMLKWIFVRWDYWNPTMFIDILIILHR